MPRSFVCITSLTNSIVKDVVKLRENASYRKTALSCIAAGNDVVREVINFPSINPGQLIKRLFVTDESLIPKRIRHDERIMENTFVVSLPVMEKLADMPNPSKIIAQFHYPLIYSRFTDDESKNVNFSQFKRILALSSINDPANMGSLLRSACAFEWDAIFLLRTVHSGLQVSSCDPFSTVCISAARGTQFKIPVVKASWEDARSFGLPFLFADIGIEGSSLSVEKVSAVLKKGCILVLSNESKGNVVQPNANDYSITIPMNRSLVDSLNVGIAGSILMHSIGSEAYSCFTINQTK